MTHAQLIDLLTVGTVFGPIVGALVLVLLSGILGKEDL